MEVYRRSCSLKERWFLSGEFACSDLEEVARRVLAARCRKVVIIETTDPDDIVEAR